MSQQQMMESISIPYDEIDPEMRELIFLLNFHVGIKTEYCCIGEKDWSPTYIAFCDSVTDDQIIQLHNDIKLLNVKGNNPNSNFKFYKWLRVSKSKDKMCWIFETLKEDKIENKIKFVNVICECIKNKYSSIK